MRKTLFLSVSDICRLIEFVGLPQFLGQLTDRIQADFARWQEFEKCPRFASYSAEGVVELMPTSDGSMFSFKFVNGHPKNPLIGLPTVMGFGCLADVATGCPLLISEMTLLTAIRTAATSVVAARSLANKGARSMAMIGNGAQSEFQVLAFFELLGVNRVNLFDTDAEATSKLMANLQGVAGLNLTAHATSRDSIRNSEIVTTSTASKLRASVLVPEMLEDGMHVNAIGGDCPGKTEVHPDVLSRAKVFVEFEAQARIEGEIQQMPPSFPVTELWEVVAGLKPGRLSPSDVTLFDSVGFSIEDFTTLCLVKELADRYHVGSDIELVPDMRNVKDLYGDSVGRFRRESIR